jgi:hypothetical protein
MRLKTAFVRSTFVWFDCHWGNGNLRPELSNLGCRGQYEIRRETGHFVFVPVLASGGTMEIDDHLEIVFFCPSDGAHEVVVLSLDEGLVRTDVVRPIPDRNSHVIESKNSTIRNRGLGFSRVRTQLLRLPQSRPQ